MQLKLVREKIINERVSSGQQENFMPIWPVTTELSEETQMASNVSCTHLLALQYPKHYYIVIIVHTMKCRHFLKFQSLFHGGFRKLLMRIKK